VSIKNLFILIIACSILATAISLFKAQPVVNDSVEYQNLANNLISNNLYFSGNAQTDVDYRLFSKRTPGYALFLAFQKNQIALLIAQVLCYLLLVILGLKLLQQFSKTQFSKKMYLAIVLFSPVLLFHSQLKLSDLLLSIIVLISLTIWFENRVQVKNKWRLIFVFWSIGLLVKPVLLPSLILLPFVALYLFIKSRIFTKLVILPIAIWASICYVNYTTTSVFEYSSISTINLAHYNAKLTIASKYGNDSAQHFTDSKIYLIPTLPQTYRAYLSNLNTAAKDAILQNFPTYLKIQTMGMAKMLLDPGRWELYTYFNQNTADGSLTELLYARKWTELNAKMQSNKALFYSFILLLIINLIKVLGIAFSFLRPTKQWFVLAAISAYFLAITGPIGAARFMLPATILSIVLSVYGWTLFLNFFQKRSKS
jgi:hypothetical protein